MSPQTKDIASIYNRYVDDLSVYATYLGFDKETVMDAVHDVFCKLAADKNVLNSVENAKFYLFKALKNRLYDIYRSRKEYINFTSSEITNELPFNLKVNMEDDFIHAEEGAIIRQQIEKMLASLTKRQREIIYLRYVQEYDYQQISDLMNISVHGCHKLASKAMQNLREKYGSLIFLFLLS